MTVENGPTMTRKASEIRFRYLRVVRIVCHDAGEETTCRIVAFTEERSIREKPREITEVYLVDRTGVGHIGTSAVIAYAENEDLNAAAQEVFSGLQGRSLDNTRILRLIEAIVDSSGKLALARPIPL